MISEKFNCNPGEKKNTFFFGYGTGPSSGLWDPWHSPPLARGFVLQPSTPGLLIGRVWISTSLGLDPFGATGIARGPVALIVPGGDDHSGKKKQKKKD